MSHESHERAKIVISRQNDINVVADRSYLPKIG